MEEIKLKIADFAKQVGCSEKTIYNKISKGELMKVNEIQKGRTITYIITNSKEIEELKNIYSSMKFNELQYYDSETFSESKCNSENYNEGSKSDTVGELVDKVMELAEKFNERLLNYNEEIVKYKSQVPLLEDKQQKEGMYLQEIKDLNRNITDLKTDNAVLENDNKKLNKFNKICFWGFLIAIFLLFITVLSLSILLVIEHNKPPKVIETEKVVEKVVEKPVYKYIKR